jgi:hypothetical protein
MTDIHLRSAFLHKNYPVLWTGIFAHRTHKNRALSFDRRKYLIHLYKNKNPNINVMKSTQCGVSEWLIVKAWNRAEHGRGVFYVLPTYNLKNTFVKDRFDRSIEYSNYYRSFQLATKEFIVSESSTLKHIGRGSINFVGSNSSVAFTSYAGDVAIIDEEDECDQENLKMTPERLSDCPDPEFYRVGNPKVSGVGIDHQYSISTRMKWGFKCDKCNHWIMPDFFVHLVTHEGENDYVLADREWTRDSERDIYMICDKCHRPVNKFADGEWIPEQKSDIDGYHISKLFSGAVTNKYMIERFTDGLSDETAMQRFYNGDLGLPHTSKGAKIDYDMLDDCIEQYTMPNRCKDVCTMGVDVGSKLHVRINQILHNGQDRAVYIGAVNELSDIVELLTRYNVKCGIIDALPELRIAKQFTKLGKGFFRCQYKETNKDLIDRKNKTITVDRTSSLDNIKAKINIKTQILPRNARSLLPLLQDTKGSKVSEYYFHMCASTRVFDEKRNKYIWVEGSKADHLFHAENYCNIAKKLLKR